MSKIMVARVGVNEWTEWEKARFEDLTGILFLEMLALFASVDRDTYDQADPSTWPKIPQKALLGILWVGASRKVQNDDLTLKEAALGFEFEKKTDDGDDPKDGPPESQDTNEAGG